VPVDILRNFLIDGPPVVLYNVFVTDSFVSTIPVDRIAEFCKRWKIQELALFGSALRDDFRPDSDLDLIATFAADADWSLLDHVQMQLELERLFCRHVDLISRRALEQSQNWLLREEILRTARILFQSGEVTRAAR
jgi:predicted nucleotidyltransferase